MTTLLHLSQTIVDMQQELSREQRFASDSCVALLKGVSLLRDATDALEKDIKVAFEERDRAVTRMLGNSAPFTTTIDPDDPLGLMPALHNVIQRP
jgi:hypothetical protein